MKSQPKQDSDYTPVTLVAGEIPQWRERCIRHGFVNRHGTAPDARLWVKQVHGARIINAEELQQQPASKEADGLWTTRPGEIVAVRTADCLPVLFYGKVEGGQSLVMAVHAGWRGLSAGILTEAVALLRSKGVKAEDITAAVGPAIGLDAFEVGPEVVAGFIAGGSGKVALDSQVLQRVSRDGRGDRKHLYLAGIAGYVLRNAGLLSKNIFVVENCTKTNGDWFSYRREGSGVGSNWAWIGV